MIYGYIKIYIVKSHNLRLEKEISERKRIEQDLSESRQQYLDIVKLLPEAIFDSDLSGKITYVNDTGVRLFGYSHSDFEKGIYVQQLISPECMAEMRLHSSTIFKTGQEKRSEFIGVKKDGSTFPFSINATPVQRNNKFIGTRGIVIDFTEQKRIEEELKKFADELVALNASKDKFFSIIAHDLKSPFSGFLGLTKVISERIDSLTMKEIQELGKDLQEVSRQPI